MGPDQVCHLADDGSPVAAGVLLFSGTPGSATDAFNVVGTHKYTEEGDYTVTSSMEMK